MIRRRQLLFATTRTEVAAAMDQRHRILHNISRQQFIGSSDPKHLSHQNRNTDNFDDAESFVMALQWSVFWYFVVTFVGTSFVVSMFSTMQWLGLTLSAGTTLGTMIEYLPVMMKLGNLSTSQWELAREVYLLNIAALLIATIGHAAAIDEWKRYSVRWMEFLSPAEFVAYTRKLSILRMLAKIALAVFVFMLVFDWLADFRYEILRNPTAMNRWGVLRTPVLCSFIFMLLLYLNVTTDLQDYFFSDDEHDPSSPDGDHGANNGKPQRPFARYLNAERAGNGHSSSRRSFVPPDEQPIVAALADWEEIAQNHFAPPQRSDKPLQRLTAKEQPQAVSSGYVWSMMSPEEVAAGAVNVQSSDVSAVPAQGSATVQSTVTIEPVSRSWVRSASPSGDNLSFDMNAGAKAAPLSNEQVRRQTGMAAQAAQATQATQATQAATSSLPHRGGTSAVMASDLSASAATPNVGAQGQGIESTSGRLTRLRSVPRRG